MCSTPYWGEISLQSLGSKRPRMLHGSVAAHEDGEERPGQVAPRTRAGRGTPGANRCQNVQPEKRELGHTETTHNSQDLGRDQPQLGPSEHSF